jgi:hypothetical protein
MTALRSAFGVGKCKINKKPVTRALAKANKIMRSEFSPTHSRLFGKWVIFPAGNNKAILMKA